MATGETDPLPILNNEAGERAKAIRRGLGLTLQEAAERSGVAVATIHGYERGADAKGSTLQALADVYGVSVDYLLGRAGRDYETELVDARKAVTDIAGIAAKFIGDEGSGP